MRYFIALLLTIFLVDSGRQAMPRDGGGCTIGVFSGRVTSDGRPILWKNRDVTNAVQKFCYYPRSINGGDTTLAFTGNTYSHDTTRVFMGANEAGFALINANSYNLNDYMTDGVDDGALMRLALERCRTLADFEHILDITSIVGRRDCWNFGAIDAYGNGAIYEAANNYYTKFDVNDPHNENNGWILRVTFSFSGGDSLDGFARLKRATHLVTNRLRSYPIDIKFILQNLARDLANPYDDPYPLPYNGSQNGRPQGFILTEDVTINREVTRSLMAIRGVMPGDDPCLTTLYSMIGPPVLSVVFPLWVGAASVPSCLNFGSSVPMYMQVNQRRQRLYGLGGDIPYLDSRYLIGKDSIGLFTYTLPLENRILAMTDNYLNAWRHETPSAADLRNVQTAIAETAYQNYLQIPLDFPHQPEITSGPLLANYPNPFNSSTTISLGSFSGDARVEVAIYDIMGRRVRSFDALGGKDNSVTWDGRDSDSRPLASGVYLIQASDAQKSLSSKAVMIK
jgi:hypothetical protein